MSDDCPRGVCGRPHPKCQAHTKAGNPCQRWPAAEQEVCPRHGGATPQAKAAAKTRAVEKAAAAELRRRWQVGDETPIEDPLTELARLAGEAVAFKDYLRDQVTELEGTLTYWQEKDYDTDEDGLGGWTKAAEDMRAVVHAYERAQDRCAKVLASIVKLDLAGRMLELNTAKAAMIVGAVREGLAQVDMDAEVRRAVQEAVAEALAGLARPVLHTPPKELTA